jgi:hypothetical protein
MHPHVCDGHPQAQILSKLDEPALEGGWWKME